MPQSDCPFCKIIAGGTSAAILFQDEQVTAFQDIHPITPVHILIVPNQHIESVDHLDPQYETLLGHMIITAKDIARQKGLDKTGYRLVFNTGGDAGQSVFHLHLHLIGGRHMPFRFDQD